MTEHGSGMGSSFSTFDSSERSDLSDRLDRGGFLLATCLLAWLQWRYPRGSTLRAVSFTELAPTGELSKTVLGVLRVCDFVVASNARRSLLHAVAAEKISPWHSQGWILDPSLGAEYTVRDTCQMFLSSFSHTDSSLAEAADLWRLLAIAECSSYLTLELEKHHLDGRWVAEAAPAIEKIIERVPIAQAFYICWLGVRDIASAYLKYPHSRDMLGSTLRSSLEQKLGRAVKERWALRSFNRHALCSESSLASVFLAATGLHDEYLQVTVSPESLAKCIP